MRPTLIIAFILLLLRIGYSQDDRYQNLSKTFDSVRDSLGFSGILTISLHDTVYFQERAGFAIKEFDEPISAETKFRIASLSKPIISYAIYRLVDQGALDLDEKISTYLPKIKEEIGSQVALKHLINHTSGLVREFMPTEEGNTMLHYERRRIEKLINQTDLQFTPGEQYAYSNTGYTLLAFIIEEATELPLQSALDSLIFSPLGMKATGHEELNGVYDKFARGYDRLGDSLFRSPYEDKSHVYGAGSLYSTASDLSRFCKEVMEGSLLSAEAHAEYLREVGRNKTNGGWITWNYKSKLNDGPDSGRVFYFAGSCPGFRSFIGIYAEHKVAIVGLMNQVPIHTSALNNLFGNIMLGFEPEIVARPELQMYWSDILHGDLNETYLAYKKRVAVSRNRTLSMKVLNQAGYMLLGQNKTEEAIRFFRFATMLFPEEANAFDSLGEALIRNEEIMAGLEAYQRSLKLNPENGNAKEMIKRYSAP